MNYTPHLKLAVGLIIAIGFVMYATSPVVKNPVDEIDLSSGVTEELLSRYHATISPSSAPSAGDKVLSENISVYLDNRRIDTFPSHAAERVDFIEGPFFFDDFDGDGDVDMSEVAFLGATGNTGYEYYLFNKTTGKFEHKPKLSGLSGYKNGKASTFFKSGCARACYVGSVYEIPDPNLDPILVSEEVAELYPGDETYSVFLITKRQRVNGEMVIISTSTVSQ